MCKVKIIENKTYFRPKTIAKIMANTMITTVIIPIIINNFFKWKKKQTNKIIFSCAQLYMYVYSHAVSVYSVFYVYIVDLSIFL